MLVEHDNFPALYADYLATGNRLLGMEVGIVSRIEGPSYTVLAVQPAEAGYAAGDVFELGETLCALVVGEDRLVAIESLGADRRTEHHPVYVDHRLAAYLAAPIRVFGAIYGTLNFTSSIGRAEPFCDEDRDLVELMAGSLGRVIERDIAEQERALAAQLIHENGELFENAFRHAPIGMALVGTDGRWLRVNAAVTQMLGYSEDELLEIDFQSVTHPEDLDADMELVRSVLAGEIDSYRMEKRYFHRHGHTVWGLLSVSLVRDEWGRPRNFVSQIQDITDQKRAQQELDRKNQELQRVNAQLEELAMVDPLTRVLNRRAFSQRLNAELSQCQRSGLPLSLLLVDVDHFKRFNDDFGHLEGDKALCRVAHELSSAARQNDIVARYGGEEFAVVLPNTDGAGCRVVAERMRTAIERIASAPRPLTASVGAATYVPRRNRGTEIDPAGLIRPADEALYAAKGSGRNVALHADDLA